MTRARISWFTAACLLLLVGWDAAAQDNFRRVDTEDLARNPRKYFALPILYRDTLVSAPSSSRIRLDRQSYHPFTLKTLGVCYATEALREPLRDVPAGRDYFFTGTVLPQGSRFYVIAQSFSPAVDEETATSDLRSGAKGGGAALQEALRNIQSVHLAYAKGNQIELCELYDPQSPHYAKAMDLARAELSALEQKEKTDSIEILARYTVGVLADKCPPPASLATAAVEEASAEVEIEPVEIPEGGEEPAEAAEEEPAPAKSWWARHKERRAAAAAERARRQAEAQPEAADVDETEPENLTAAPDTADEAVPLAPEPTAPINIEPPVAAEPAPARTNLTWSQRRALAREKEADLRAKKEQKAELERAEARKRAEAAQREAEARKREARERKQAEREKKLEARRAAEAARAAKAAADAGELSPSATFELRATPATEDESLGRSVAE